MFIIINIKNNYIIYINIFILYIKYYYQTKSLLGC